MRRGATGLRHGARTLLRARHHFNRVSALYETAQRGDISGLSNLTYSNATGYSRDPLLERSNRFIGLERSKATREREEPERNAADARAERPSDVNAR